jgi:NAD(P)-dependent dehydrogenase (short-subunit alcohol dehydrogenase family)
MIMSKALAGKVALVTGGSRGIGAAIAEALADQGADVAISYVASAVKADDVVRRLTAKGVKAVAFKADQADRAQVDRLVRHVAEHFGRLDILVNNAGVAVNGAVDDPNADIVGFDRQYAVNLQAVVAAIRAAAKVMGEGGHIISIGSTLGRRASFPGLADYAATKAAIVGYSKGAARDLAPRKITVNVVETGSTDTDMNPESGEASGAQKALIALGRFAKPAEIAAGVVLLASPAASYITGTVLAVDGGFGA